MPLPRHVESSIGSDRLSRLPDPAATSQTPPAAANPAEKRHHKEKRFMLGSFGQRRAFTLVELLVVIAIIGMGARMK